MTLKGTVTAQQLAARLGTSRWTLRRWTNEGRIPGPDLRSPGGQPSYSEPLAAAIAASILNSRSADHRLRCSISDALETAAAFLDQAVRDTLTAELTEMLLDDGRIAIL
jgi:hypothetical protein